MMNHLQRLTIAAKHIYIIYYIIDGQALIILDDDDCNGLVINRIILDGYDYSDYNLVLVIIIHD